MHKVLRSLALTAIVFIGNAAYAGWGAWSPAATGLPRYDEIGGAPQYCFNSEDDPRWIFGVVQVDDFLILGHANNDPSSPFYNPGGEVIILKALPWYYQWKANLQLFWYGDLDPWGYKEFWDQPSGSPGWAAFPTNKNNTHAMCRVS